MKFDVQKDGTTVTFTLHERKLDSSISPLAKGEFLILCKPRVSQLTIDLTEVEFCDSSGLSALLIARRKMSEHGGQVILRNVHSRVRSLLKITHIDRDFTFAGSGESAGTT